jgi:hypothetical protein
MNNAIETILKHKNLKELRENAWQFLISEFHVDKSYKLIIEKIGLRVNYV